MTLRVLSLGAGVQSTTMALMAAHGEFEHMPDCAIFADTGWEPRGVYDHLDWLETILSSRFPVHRVSAGNLRQDTLDKLSGVGRRVGSIPTFSEKGMMPRQCTREYKVDPIIKKIRGLLGVAKGARVPRGISVEMWIGISTDEAARMKPAPKAWQENRWPLIEKRMSRHDCKNWFERNYPGRTLAKSACIGCPYHSDVMWRDVKDNDPASWADAVDFDSRLRSQVSDMVKIKEPQFLHRQCVHLPDVDLTTVEDEGQINMFNEECEGMCGV